MIDFAQRTAASAMRLRSERPHVVRAAGVAATSAWFIWRASITGCGCGLADAGCGYGRGCGIATFDKVRIARWNSTLKIVVKIVVSV